MRLVPLWNVEEDVLKPIVGRIAVLARLVLVLLEDLEKASQQHPSRVSFF